MIVLDGSLPFRFTKGFGLESYQTIYLIFENITMELLKDPGNTRVYKGLPLPPQKPMKSELLFQGGLVQVGLLKEFLKKEGRIAIEDFKRIVREATQIFSTPKPM